MSMKNVFDGFVKRHVIDDEKQSALFPERGPAPADMVKMANDAIEKCRERCIAAVEGSRSYGYDAPHSLIALLRGLGIYDKVQLTDFSQRLAAIEEECKILEVKVQLTKYVTGVFAEEMEEKHKKALTVPHITGAQNSSLLQQYNQMQNQKHAMANAAMANNPYIVTSYDAASDTSYINKCK